MSLKSQLVQFAGKHPQAAQKVMSLWNSIKPNVQCPGGQTPSVIIGFNGEVRLACCTPDSTICSAPLGKGKGGVTNGGALTG